MAAMSDVARLLAALERGDTKAGEELLPLVYDELRSLARAQMAQERGNHTLQATALVHETFLRLLGSDGMRWDGCGHFFGAAAEAMRRILIEHARRKKAAKRGGDLRQVELDIEMPPMAESCASVGELLSLNEALDRLAQEDAPKAELVKLLYFAGLSLDEAAAVQGLSKTTAHRRWQSAREWLQNAMVGKGAIS